MKDRLRYLEEALREIAKGSGAFSRDPAKHAENTIEHMKRVAVDALEGQWRPSDEFIDSARDTIPTDHPCRACGDASHHRAREGAFIEAGAVLRQTSGKEFADGRDDTAKALRNVGIVVLDMGRAESLHAAEFERSSSHDCAGRVA